MTSEWDGTPWGGSAVSAKASTGPGVAMLTYGTPYLMGRESVPQRLMRQAQMAYHANPWIRLAESTVTRRVVGLPWHLEDGDDALIPDDAPGYQGLVRSLIERPQMRLGVRQPAVATRRGLIALTSRHVGLCGMSHWFMDGKEALTGLPLGIMYLNPARMYQMEDEAGNLLSWMLDPKSFDGYGRPQGGLVLQLSEVLTFYLDPPDSGNIGSGLYEAAILKSQITNLADQHAAYVLGTGGRIAGILSPKEGNIDTPQFEQLEREFRNVNEASDAAKRTTILSGPVDWHPTAANPDDLNLIELGKMNRDDILALWGVPPATAGIPAPAGLNSGGTRGYDEAVLMQGAVHDRVQAIKETIQYDLLDRLSGPRIEYEVDEPEFDDRSPMYEIAAKARELPLTNAERRELVGLAPFGEADPRDLEVWLPAGLTVAYDASGAAPVSQAIFPAEVPAKAREQREFLGLRKSVETKWVPKTQSGVREVLTAQRDEVLAKLRKATADTLKRHRTDPEYWFRSDDKRLLSVLDDAAGSIAATVTERAETILRPGKAGFTDRVAKFIRKLVGERVVEINRTTQKMIQRAISEGYEQGMSPLEIAKGMEDGGLFQGLGNESVLARAERIARTETMFAYNTSAIRSYAEYGVEKVEAIDGDTDTECSERNGQVYPVDVALTIEDHPNGTLDWAPVLAGG